MLVVPLPLDATAQKVIDLLAVQALRLQSQPSSILKYISDIHQIEQEARKGDVESMCMKLEVQRLAGFQDDHVFPTIAQSLNNSLK